MWGILIPLLVGIAVGYFSPGRQDKSRLFVKGAIWAVIVAAVLVLLANVFGMNPLGYGDLSFVGLTISFIVSVVVFLVGVWIGDMFEGRRRTVPPGTPPRV